MSGATPTLTLPNSAARSRVLNAALVLAAAGVVVKLAGLGREFFLAAIYGRSDAMDALLAALLIPNLLVNLVAESMNQALIPTLMRVRLQQGHARAQELLSGSLLWLMGMLGGAAAMMALLAHALFPLIASGFPAAKLGLAIRLFYVLLPVVLLSGIASNCTAVLNTLDRFALPALAPAVIPATVVGLTFLLHDTLGIWLWRWRWWRGRAFMRRRWRSRCKRAAMSFDRAGTAVRRPRARWRTSTARCF